MPLRLPGTTSTERPSASEPAAIAGLVLANCVPLLGVLVGGWSVFEVLVVYWLESAVVGALNVPKILLAEGTGDPGTDVSLTVNGVPFDPAGADAGRAWVAGFFVVHYGVFWIVHGVFVFVLPLFAPGDPFRGGGVAVGGVILAALSMAVSHGVSFVVNYLGHEEYRTVSAADQMMQPYGRVVVLHLTIVVGAFVVAVLGLDALLWLLVALKIAMDLLAHRREHRAAATRGTD